MIDERCIHSLKLRFCSRVKPLNPYPQMMYQGEELVDTLVKARAHHYIEFKRLEGRWDWVNGHAAHWQSQHWLPAVDRSSPPFSYILGPPPAVAKATTPAGSAISSVATTTCKLDFRPVPASKSDIFKDKTLGLSEKRSLMSFLTTAMQAAAAAAEETMESGSVPSASKSPTGGAGKGLKLKEVLSSPTGAAGTSLVDVLRAEGVPLHLRHVVVHGIAMCDFGQEEEEINEGASGAVGDRRMMDSAPGIGVKAVGGRRGGLMTAKEGIAALNLLGKSMSRFGGQGAFMVPSWGCGSIPEAFVR